MSGPSNAQLAAQVSDLLTRWNAREDQVQDWIGGLADGGPQNDGRYPLSDATGATRLVPCPAALAATASGPAAVASGHRDGAEDARDEALAEASRSEAQRVLADSAKAAALAARDLTLQYRDRAANAEANAEVHRQYAEAARLGTAADLEATGDHRDAAEYAAAEAENHKIDAAASAAAAGNFNPALYATRTDGLSQIAGLQAALDARLLASGFTWAALPGKPSTFAPSAHSHAIGDVTGLQTALDGKQAAGSYAAASHGHVISDVTGLQAALDAKVASGSAGSLSSLTVGAPGGTTGIIYLGQNQTSPAYLYWNGGAYYMPSGPLHVNGSQVWTAATFNPASKSDVGHGHAMSDITGLGSALSDRDANIATKAPANNPTFTGNIVYGNGNEKLIIHQHAGGITFTPSTPNGADWMWGNDLRFDRTNSRWNFTGLLHVQDNPVWHQGNFSPSGKANVGGGNASGTWPISVTGASSSTALLAGRGSYINSLSDPTNSYETGMQLAFVSSGGGWPDFGTVITAKSYPGGGGSLQLYVPYSDTYGGTGLRYRTGQYTGTDPAPWGAFKTLWDTGNFNPADKANAVHSHDWAQVTGKPNLLAFTHANAYDWTPGTLGATWIGGWHGSTGSGDQYVSFGSTTGRLHWTIDGEYYANDGQSKVWHSGNFNPDTKLGVSATAATAVTSGLLSSNTGAQSGSLQYWNTVGNTTLNPDSDWWYALRMGHGDADTYYSGSLALAFFTDTLRFRRKVNGSNQSWRSVWHDGNFDPTTKANLSGASFTGDVWNSGGGSFKVLEANATRANQVYLGADGDGGYIHSTYGSGGTSAFRVICEGSTRLQVNTTRTFAHGELRTPRVQFDTVRSGAVGQYDATQTQAVWAMGADYQLTAGGASNQIGNLYGLAWSYEPNYGGAGNNPQSKPELYHQLLLMQNGVTSFAAGVGIWTSGRIECAGNGGWTMGAYANKNRIDYDGSKFRFINAANANASVEISSLTAYGNITASGGLTIAGGTNLNGDLVAASGTVYTSGGLIYSTNWWRSTGTTGWFNATYSTGIWSTQAGEVRTYNGSRFHSEGNLSSGGVVISAMDGGFQNAGYVSGRNRIWSFANADSYGISYYQGAGGWSGMDTINFHFGNTAEGSTLHKFRADGVAAHAGDLYVKGSRLPVFTSSTGSPSGGVDGDIHITY
jgi:hypothetical protein